MRYNNDSKSIMAICAIAAIVVIALLIWMEPAKAGDQPQHVTTYTSQPGETLDAFAVRIAPNAMRHSSSGEICGEFRKSNDTYTIDMFTIGKLRECAYARVGAIGYTGLTFHTHPKSPARFTPADYDAHPGYMTTGQVVMFQSGRGTAKRVNSL